MARLGAPVASERHALEASLAALEMQRRIAEYNQKRQAKQEMAIQIRVGLHSGEVVVLEVGDDPKKPEYDATGSSVPLAARMDQLPEQDKWALRAVSVLGQRFEIEALRHLIEQPDYDCRILVEHHLVRPEGPLYLFTHALIQGGAYGSLLKSQRCKLHLIAAEWFKERDLVLYAEHLDHAGDASAAQAYLSTARIQSDHFRPERALQLVRRGLEIAPNTDRFELNCFEGELLQILWDVTDSILAYRRALDFSGDDIQRCRALVGVAEGLGISQVHDELIEVLETAQDIGKKHGLTLELARINQVRGRAHFIRGEIELPAGQQGLAGIRA